MGKYRPSTSPERGGRRRRHARVKGRKKGGQPTNPKKRKIPIHHDRGRTASRQFRANRGGKWRKRIRHNHTQRRQFARGRKVDSRKKKENLVRGQKSGKFRESTPAEVTSAGGGECRELLQGRNWVRKKGKVGINKNPPWGRKGRFGVPEKEVNGICLFSETGGRCSVRGKKASSKIAARRTPECTAKGGRGKSAPFSKKH